jgi:hypothetical protein
MIFPKGEKGKEILMTHQKQWLSSTQTAKKQAAHMAQDQNASAFEGIVELDEEPLDQVTGGGYETKYSTYHGRGTHDRPKEGDMQIFKSIPGTIQMGDGVVYQKGKWRTFGPQ